MTFSYVKLRAERSINTTLLVIVYRARHYYRPAFKSINVKKSIKKKKDIDRINDIFLIEIIIHSIINILLIEIIIQNIMAIISTCDKKLKILSKKND